MANKVKYGLRNVHYSIITIEEDGSYSYATPVAIPGAVNLSMSASGDTNDFYADDVVYYTNTTNQGYEGDLEIALIPESFLTDVMGYTKDTNGAIVESADAKAKAFALGFEVQGDEKGRRTWLYNCKAGRSNQDASTKDSGSAPSTESLSLKAMPRLNDKMVKVAITENETNKSIYDSFFGNVYEKNSSI